MKIYYEPYRGYNKKYDFVYTDDVVLEFSFTEPEEPKLIREIGVDYIIEGITERDGFSYYLEPLIMRQLLPEQIRVLMSHAFRIPFSELHFVNQLRNEVEQLAKQEIEPGIFKDEDIL
jgi:hypothetical protein